MTCYYKDWMRLLQWFCRLDCVRSFQGQFKQNTSLWIILVVGGDVMVDNNHPLAGVQLNFAVEVTGVREATKIELEHGHVHDGNEHHG